MKQINTINGYEEIRDWYFVTSCGRTISIRKYFYIQKTKI